MTWTRACGARGTGDESPRVRSCADAGRHRGVGPGPAPAAFRVSWQRETDPVARRIEGRVHNDSPFRVTDLRLEVQDLDADRPLVGRTFTRTIGDIVPGGQTSVVFQAMPEAVSDRLRVR